MNTTLHDHFKGILKEELIEKEQEEGPQAPLDLAFKPGESIKVTDSSQLQELLKFTDGINLSSPPGLYQHPFQEEDQVPWKDWRHWALPASSSYSCRCSYTSFCFSYLCYPQVSCPPLPPPPWPASTSGAPVCPLLLLLRGAPHSGSSSRSRSRSRRRSLLPGPEGWQGSKPV